MNTSIRIARPQLQKVLDCNSTSAAGHWIRRAKMEPIERGGRHGMVYFDAHELLAFFEENKYLPHASLLQAWIDEQEVAKC